MRAMARGESELMLGGLVEMDESYVGGRGTGPRGRGSKGKTPVAVVAGHSGSGGLSIAHMQVVENVSGRELGQVTLGAVKPGSTVMTDGLAPYRKLSSLGYTHEPRIVKNLGKAHELLPHVHLVISNFKRWVLDVFHGVSSKHLQSYLDEFCYRLNRRYARTDLFRRILNRCARFTEPVTYAELTAA